MGEAAERSRTHPTSPIFGPVLTALFDYELQVASEPIKIVAYLHLTGRWVDALLNLLFRMME